MSKAKAAMDLFQMLQGLWTAHLVSCLAKLEIADRVGEGPQTAEELAKATGTQAPHLQRVLRTAAALGLLEERGDGKFGQTELSAVLRRDAQPGLKGVACFFSDPWHTRAWDRLEEVVRTGRAGVELEFGTTLFEYFGRNPGEAPAFHLGMTNLSTMEGPAVAAACDFSGMSSVCDVGGGHGFLLSLILQRNPGLSAVLFDKQEVVEGAQAQGHLAGLDGRLEFRAGDMFSSIPSGMDAYVLKRIVHDWPDEASVRLLRNCREGVNAGGKLYVVEQVIVTGAEGAAAMLMDLEMMVLLNGRERDEGDFRRMFAAAGWKLNRVLRTESPMYVMEGVAA